MKIILRIIILLFVIFIIYNFFQIINSPDAMLGVFYYGLIFIACIIILYILMKVSAIF